MGKKSDQANLVKFKIIIPDAEAEFTNLWRVLKEFPFYLKEGYKITLPTNPKFLNLIEGYPKKAKLRQKDIREIFVNEIYSVEFFDQAKTVLEMKIKSRRMNKLIYKLLDFQKNWDFKVYPEYKLILTAYGSYGNYNSDEASITLVVGPDGQIKDSQPVNTLVHEIVHLGLQEEIVDRFKLAHWEKERLVDLICLKWLGNIAENYQLQEGDNRMDSYIDEKARLNLLLAIQQYVKAYPR